MTEQAIRIKIAGIKCDNEECDFRDGEVDRDNYKEYVDKPCPECGSILLTQEDYDTVQALERVAFEINVDIPESLIDGSEVTFSVEMDGSGDLKLGDISDVKKS